MPSQYYIAHSMVSINRWGTKCLQSDVLAVHYSILISHHQEPTRCDLFLGNLLAPTQMGLVNGSSLLAFLKLCHFERADQVSMIYNTTFYVTVVIYYFKISFELFPITNNLICRSFNVCHADMGWMFDFDRVWKYT